MAGLALTVDIAPHRRNRPRCARCGQVGPVYDRLAPRRCEFVPLWSLRVFFLYMMRRVECPQCGVTVEQVPWADSAGYESRPDHRVPVSTARGGQPH